MKASHFNTFICHRNVVVARIGAERIFSGFLIHNATNRKTFSLFKKYLKIIVRGKKNMKPEISGVATQILSAAVSLPLKVGILGCETFKTCISVH